MYLSESNYRPRQEVGFRDFAKTNTGQLLKLFDVLLDYCGNYLETDFRHPFTVKRGVGVKISG